MIGRRQALTFARQYRTCPPLRVIGDSAQAGNVGQHRAICPYCALHPGPDTGWGPLAEAIIEAAGAKKRSGGVPQPGDIRPIRAEKAMWRKAMYYSPPWVMVAAPIGPSTYRVAQTYHDIWLAGPGDLILPFPPSSGMEGFVEGWNAYPVLADDLGPLIWRPKPAEYNDILGYLGNPAKLPVWANIPAPMEADDPRFFFRELEAAVARIFAAPAAGAPWVEPVPNTPPLAYRCLADLVQALKKLRPGTTVHGKPADLPQLLAACRLPVEHYALAAADTPADTLPVNVVAVDNGKVVGLSGATAVIHLKTSGPRHHTVSGRIENLPKAAAGGSLICFWQSINGTMRHPATLTWEPDEAVFVVRLAGSAELDGSFKMALVYEP
jgi:hypothetical protein